MKAIARERRRTERERRFGWVGANGKREGVGGTYGGRERQLPGRWGICSGRQGSENYDHVINTAFASPLLPLSITFIFFKKYIYF